MPADVLQTPAIVMRTGPQMHFSTTTLALLSRVSALQSYGNADARNVLRVREDDVFLRSAFVEGTVVLSTGSCFAVESEEPS